MARQFRDPDQRFACGTSKKRLEKLADISMQKLLAYRFQLPHRVLMVLLDSADRT